MSMINEVMGLLTFRKIVLVAILVSLMSFLGFVSSARSIEGDSAFRFRALQIVTRKSTPSEIKNLIDKAKEARFNAIILGIGWHGTTRLKSMPWADSVKDAWSRDDLLSVVSYARKNGIDVVPHIQLLSHQNSFLGPAYPELLFNAVTYDPRNPQVYNIVLPILDEVIELLNPKAIHIGHDEVVGWKTKHFREILKPGEQMLPAELFLKDVNRIHAYLKKRGVETWMWGDMLIAPKKFPSMREGGLHGGAPGYGAELRKRLPKDIVICDWHYFDKQNDFPSLATFKKEGFRVMGSTWKNPETIRNFSRYAAAHGAYGMIATTWFHVPKKEWDVVDQIIRESGRAFLKDFPDVRGSERRAKE